MRQAVGRRVVTKLVNCSCPVLWHAPNFNPSDWRESNVLSQTIRFSHFNVNREHETRIRSSDGELKTLQGLWNVKIFSWTAARWIFSSIPGVLNEGLDPLAVVLHEPEARILTGVAHSRYFRHGAFGLLQREARQRESYWADMANQIGEGNQGTEEEQQFLIDFVVTKVKLGDILEYLKE
ncbi:hypothetical protein LZ30DRAFT_215664 [Colletotrichum cereale]|nr:hypothetical protein LZ30DRAFT_215664 [Colletotrichum cereale]